MQWQIQMPSFMCDSYCLIWRPDELLILAGLILRELETSATSSKGRQLFSVGTTLIRKPRVHGPLCGGSRATSPRRIHVRKACITWNPQEAHFVLTGTHFALERCRISSNCFLLKLACTSKSWSRLQNCRSRSLVWRTQERAPRNPSLSVMQPRKPTHWALYARWHVSGGVRTDSKGPGSLILTWDDFKNSVIPY